MQVEVQANVTCVEQRTPDGVIAVGAVHPFTVVAISGYASRCEVFGGVNAVARFELAEIAERPERERRGSRQKRGLATKFLTVGRFSLPLSMFSYPDLHHQATPKPGFKTRALTFLVGLITHDGVVKNP